MDQEWEAVFRLYERTMLGAMEYWQQQVQREMRRSVYTTPVVVWLMIEGCSRAERFPAVWERCCRGQPIRY